MVPDDILNENDGEQEEEQEEEQVENIIDLNNYGMKPYAWRYEGSGGGGGEGGGGYLKITSTRDETGETLDKTVKEIFDAMNNGYFAALIRNDGVEVQTKICQSAVIDDIEPIYMVMIDDTEYYANSADDYPKVEW